MKPKLQFSIPCLEVREDGGPPSFLRIFYELPFPNFPFTFPTPGFYVANGWCNGKGDFAQGMKILNPDRTLLIQTGDQPFTLKEQETPFMAVNLFAEVIFEKPGIYYFQIFLKENLEDAELQLEYPLIIREAETASK
ncbi:MAG: hypothetical protein HYU63_01350 [Armatimonadetes bacterium]|nr:hypothetical protein [Armatimonadota bacterium]